MNNVNKPAAAGSVESMDASDPTQITEGWEPLVSLPRVQRISLMGRRLYQALLRLSESRSDAMRPATGSGQCFEAPIGMLMRPTGSPADDRVALERYLRELRAVEMDCKCQRPSDVTKWRAFSMLSEVAIETRGDNDWVSWSFAPTIMAALKEPGRRTCIDLGILGQLGSYSALALYDICSRHRGAGMTPRQPVQWWAQVLSPTASAAQRREWRKVKSERVAGAIDEINRETDLEVELIEHKVGRAVAEVEFAVSDRSLTASVGSHSVDLVDAGLVLQAEALGVREIELEGLIRAFGDDKVREAVAAVQKGSPASAGSPVVGAHARLYSLLRDGLLSGAISARPQSSDEHDVPCHDEGTSALITELAAMDPAHRQDWIERAVDDLRKRDLLTGVVQRRANQGDWAHGLLGTHLVRLYAATLSGAAEDKAASSEPSTSNGTRSR